MHQYINRCYKELLRLVSAVLLLVPVLVSFAGVARADTGDIGSIIDTLEFDVVGGTESDIVHVSGDVYAIAYEGPGSDGFLKTVEIATNGQITDTVIDTLEFDTSNGETPSIIHVSGNVYAIAYEGPGDDGFLKTVEIAGNGQITNSIIDTLEFDTSRGKYPDMIHVSGNVYAIAFEGNDYDGFLKTVEIAADGQLTDTVIDTLEFDTSRGKFPDIIHVTGNVYAVAYTGDGDDGFLKTVEIAADGQITNTVIDTLEFDTAKGKYADIIHVTGNVYAIAYAGDGDDGFLKTVEIASNGQVTDTVIDTLEFDTSNGRYPDMIHVSDDVYAIAYDCEYDEGYLTTVEIATNGQIGNTVIDTLEFDAARGKHPDIVHVSGDVYAIAYEGADYDGFLKTVAIESQVVVVPTATTDNATLVEETTATLYGTINSDGGEACQYRFEYGTVSGGPYSSDTGWTGSKSTGQSFSAAITGLGKGIRYYFRAQAENGSGTGSGPEKSFLTKPDPPVSSSLSAVVVSDTRIDLSWTKGEGAGRTMVRRKMGDYPANIADGVQVYFDAGTGVSDTGLTPGTLYYYRAWSEITGSQQWSDGYVDAAATTSGAAVPPKSVGGTVYPVDRLSIILPWLLLFSVLSLAIARVAFHFRKHVKLPRSISER